MLLLECYITFQLFTTELFCIHTKKNNIRLWHRWFIVHSVYGTYTHMTSYWHRCDVITSQQSQYDVILTLCACWVVVYSLFVAFWAFDCSCMVYICLSYDITVIHWITSCHKNRMTTRVITLWCVCVTSLTTSVSTMRFHIELMLILKAVKSRFKGAYNK